MEGEQNGCCKQRNMQRNINSFFQCPYEDTQKTGEHTFIINAKIHINYKSNVSSFLWPTIK